MGVYGWWTVPDGWLVSAADCLVHFGCMDVDYSVGGCVGRWKSIKLVTQRSIAQNVDIREGVDNVPGQDGQSV